MSRLLARCRAAAVNSWTALVHDGVPFSSIKCGSRVDFCHFKQGEIEPVGFVKCECTSARWLLKPCSGFRSDTWRCFSFWTLCLFHLCCAIKYRLFLFPLPLSCEAVRNASQLPVRGMQRTLALSRCAQTFCPSFSRESSPEIFTRYVMVRGEESQTNRLQDNIFKTCGLRGFVISPFNPENLLVRIHQTFSRVKLVCGVTSTTKNIVHDVQQARYCVLSTVISTHGFQRPWC